MTENYFTKLNSIDVSDKVEKKNNLSYLSWAYAWTELKKIHPDANYTVYEREDGCIYWTDNKTAWVKTGVTVNKIEHIEYLPIMDYRNKSILVDNITSFDINKAIQRSLTKAVARHGLGLYIYAGEDLPEDNNKSEDNNKHTNFPDNSFDAKITNAVEEDLTEMQKEANKKTLQEFLDNMKKVKDQEGYDALKKKYTPFYTKMKKWDHRIATEIEVEFQNKHKQLQTILRKEANDK